MRIQVHAYVLLLSIQYVLVNIALTYISGNLVFKLQSGCSIAAVAEGLGYYTLVACPAIHTPKTKINNSTIDTSVH